MASPKRKPKPKEKEGGSEKPQSDRFKETARDLGLETSDEAFEKALQKIVPPKRN